MREEWRDVVGYEGYYQISSLGRVKNLRREVKSGNGTRIAEENIISQRTDRGGYKIACLSIDRKKKTFPVHRLVAKAFIENKENYPVVNHIDENKTNNMVNNLEWCTVDYNNKYGTRTIRAGLKRRKQVIQLLNGIEVARYGSISEVNELCNFCISQISKCCNGKRKQAYGFQWRFVSEVLNEQ